MNVLNPHLTGTLLILHEVVLDSRSTTSALVRAELARRNPRLEELIDLFKRAALDFGEEEVQPERGEEAGWRPDIAIFRPPVERIRVDKVWSRESSQPLWRVR